MQYLLVLKPINGKCMLNKFLLALTFFVISDCVMAQFINLQKNNSFHKLKIKLPKKVTINYLNGSTIQKIKAKTIKYSFPNLTLVKNHDTIILNVQKILNIKYSPTFSPAYYVLMFPVTLFAGSFIGVAFYDPVETGFIVPFIMGASLGCYDYFLFTHANRKLNTNLIWSFY